MSAWRNPLEWLTTGRRTRAAREAELAGDLAAAVQSWMDAGKSQEAARVLVVRASAAVDLEQRFAFLVRARDLAPPGSTESHDAVTMLADLVVARTGSAALSAASRHELSMVAGDLERIGEHARAAELFQRSGDTEGRARNLAMSGGVDELDDALAHEAFTERLENQQAKNVLDAEAAAAGGNRREASRLLLQCVLAAPQDETVARAHHELLARRLGSSSAIFRYRGQSYTALFDEEIVIGRADVTICLSSPVVSKRHLRLARSGDEIMFEDLNTRGGTQYRGVRVNAALPLRQPVELDLAGTVRVSLARSTHFERAVEIAIAGTLYVAALGPLHVGSEEGVAWTVGRAADGWLELHTSAEHPAYRRGILQDSPVTLLRGDALTVTREGAPLIELEG